MQIGVTLQYGFLKLRAWLLLACAKQPAALATFEQMLLLRPSDAYALASHGHVAAQLRLLQESIASLRQLTVVRPEHAAAWFNLGYVLQQAERHGEAGHAFERALALDPRLDPAWYGLALVHIHARRFEEAAEALQKNTALQPLGPHGWYRLTQVWLALDQPDKARKVIAHLRRFEPRVAAQLERENGAAFATAGGVADAAH